MLAIWALSGGVLAVDACLVEPNWIEVTRSTEYVPALRANAPDLSIVHLSDLYVSRIGYRERRAIALINETRPDLILVSGDLARDAGSLPAVGEFLGALDARLGAFVVFGDRDHKSGAARPEAVAVLERAGVRVLQNASAVVRHPLGRIHIAGVDDPVTGRDNLARAMRRVPRREFCILLAHGPEIVGRLGNWDIDMVLAGPARGSQVRLPLLGALATPAGTRPMVDGWFDIEMNARLHVSRGLGSAPPLRFLSRPRIDRIMVRGGPPPGRGTPRTITRRS